MARPKGETIYAGVDFETGGLYQDKNAVTQVAVVMFDSDYKVLGEYASYIQPYNDELIYTPEALAKTGLNIEYLQDTGRPIKEVAKECKEFLDSYSGTRIFTGYNAMFDYLYWLHMEIYAGCHKSHTLFQGDVNPFSGEHMPIIRDVALDVKDYKKLTYIPPLRDAARMLDVELISAHEARYDTRVLGPIMAKMKVRATGEVEKYTRNFQMNY